ncbi:hypothetical protein BMT54_04645 [Pasteurellaceae bacterium 15-036681]|nr:hypothetical protein BMT54_04645 [Pasteurellaceae bacterium 15-036681]
MKKVVLCAVPVALAACSSSVQQSTAPMDMQAVQEYQQRVASSVSNKANAQQKAQKEGEWQLNQSDNKPKVVQVYSRPRVYPSVHYGYGWGRYGRHHSGIGVGLGGW